MSLPILQIPQWSDDKLLSVIKSGEAINWNIQLDEDDSEVECYISEVFSEAEKRNLIAV